MKKILASIAIIIFSLFFAVAPVFADNPCSKLETDGKSCVATSELLGDKTVKNGNETVHCSCDDGKGSEIVNILKLIADIMTIGIGILGVIGIVWAGIQYLTSAGDPGKAKKAKTRIFEIVIGLAIYVTIYAILRWLLPGFQGFSIS